MNKFLFITHLTPARKRSSLRQSLFEIYRTSLLNQSYSGWKVLLWGEEEKNDGAFHYRRIGEGTREEMFASLKAQYERDDVRNLIEEADYIVKLDDDDVISPVILEKCKDFSGDCYFDSFHTFHDVTSGITSQQQRAWIASTCIHKRSHAISFYDGPGASPLQNLLYSDHSKSWHAYYAGLNTTASDRTAPVYLRVLSPTSITASATNVAPMKPEDISFEKYYAYLRSFGPWNRLRIASFSDAEASITKAWNDFANFNQRPLPEMQTPSMLARLTGKLWRRS